MSAAIDKSFRQSSMPLNSTLDQPHTQNLREHYQLQRGGFQNPSVNNAKTTIRELLQPSVRYDHPLNQNSLQKYSLSPEKSTATRGFTPERKKRYMIWDDMVKDQIESGRRSLEVQKNDERLRKQLYKEDLDKLAEEQRRNKLVDRIDQINSYPEHQMESLKEFEQAYQQHQQHNKQRIRDSLDENYRQYMDKKYKMKQEKDVSDSGLLKKFEEAKRFEDLARSIERERKNVLKDEMKSDAHKHSQEVLEREVMRIVADHEHNQRETELMIQKEKDAKMFYDKIRQQSLEKNIKGLEFLQRSSDDRRPGGGHLRSLIERTRVEKSQLEEDEERFYIDRQKQKESEHLARAKRYEDELKKLDIERKEQELKKKFEDVRFYDEMKRVSEIEQKKSYQSILDQQILEKIQNKRRENELSLVEQQLMARKNMDEENEFISVPNGNLSHERQLQLKYIDKWLVRKPAIPTEMNRENRYKRESVEHSYRYSDNQNSLDIGRNDRLRR